MTTPLPELDEAHEDYLSALDVPADEDGWPESHCWPDAPSVTHYVPKSHEATWNLQEALAVFDQIRHCVQQQCLVPEIQKDLHALQTKLTEAEAMIAELQGAVRDLSGTPETAVVNIVSFAPKPFVVLREIPVFIETVLLDDSDEGCEYIARFVEASVGSTGDTLEEAIRNVKDRLVTKFDVLDRMPSHKLGKGPTRELAVLRSVMAREE